MKRMNENPKSHSSLLSNQTWRIWSLEELAHIPI